MVGPHRLHADGPAAGRARPRATPQQIWQHYADTVRAALTADGPRWCVDRDGTPAGRRRVAGTSLPDVATENYAGWWPRARHGGRRGTLGPRGPGWTGAGYLLITVPVRMHGGGAGTLLVFGLHRSLFTEDDIAVLADLGRQATVLADRAVLTARLTDTVEALRAANEAKSDFVAAMSHELRTPLNAIIGFSELMGLEEMVGDRRLVPDEWITNVHSSGRHLLGLINDVLDLAKVEAGRIELRLEPLDVGAAVAEAVAPLSPLIDGKGLRLTARRAAELVTADRLRLRQMLNNLLSNAIKFTPRGRQRSTSPPTGTAPRRTSASPTPAPASTRPTSERVFEEFHQTGDAESRAPAPVSAWR